jgi:hypothetical protein
MPTLLAVWCVVGTSFLDASARADEPTILERSGPATLRTTALVGPKKTLTLAFTDLLTLQIDVEGGDDLEVESPEAWTQGPWQVRARTPQRQTRDQRTLWSQSLEVEPLMPGDTALALAPLKVRSGGETQTVAWQPLAVRVTSRLKQPQLGSARDITAIEELPPPTEPDRSGWWIAAGVGAGAVLAGLAWLAWCRRAASRAAESPEARALREWQRLEALGLPERGRHERFSTLLTALLRRYLEKRYRLPARRLTTAEFLASLEQEPQLASQRAFFESLLQRCDLLKFAPTQTTAAECRALAEQVRDFLSQQQRSVTPGG